MIAPISVKKLLIINVLKLPHMYATLYSFPEPLISLTRSLMNIENRVGDNTQPCFTPQLISNHSESLPFILTTRNFRVKGFNKVKKGTIYAKLCLHFVP